MALLSVAPNIINLVQGEHSQISGGREVGCGKMGVQSSTQMQYPWNEATYHESYYWLHI